MLTLKFAAMEICTGSFYPPRTSPNFKRNFRIFKNRLAVEGVVFKSPSHSKANGGWRVLRALGDDANKGNTVKGWDPALEIQVPSEQRPVNELAALKGGALYSWAELTGTQFVVRLGGLWLFLFTVLGGPIAAGSFEPSREPLKFFLAAGAGSLFVVSLIVLRIYLGWSYVGDRLLSAVIPYEETGWYDGQLWVKPPEVLARDRLLGSYKVKPVTDMLKQILICSGALLATTVSLFLLVPAHESSVKNVLTSQNSNIETLVTDGKNNIRKEDLLNLPLEVMDDDKLAEDAAKAANGRPVYCTDRYYRALAGGQYCRWDDLRK